MSDAQHDELKKKTVAQIVKPYRFDGVVTHHGLKRPKKRYMIWKDGFVYLFEKQAQKETVKDIFEITKETTLFIETDSKEKHDIIKLRTSLSELALLCDDSTQSALLNAFHVYRAEIDEQQKNLAKESEPPKEPVALSSEEVNEKLEQHQGKWSGKEITDFFKQIGKPTLEKYLYTILIRMISEWSNDDFIQFAYKDFCEEDLEDMAAFLAGKEGCSEQTTFVFGRDVVGAHRIADIYIQIYKKYDLVWSELARCLLSALACWGLTSKDQFFGLVVLDIFKEFDVAETTTFLQFYASYEEEINEPSWSSLPTHVVELLKKVVEGWDEDKIKEMLKMIEATWQWKSDDVERLKDVLNQH
ncbi:PH domain-containing protein [Entamoeba marina]